MSDLPQASEPIDERVTRALRQASADAIERARIFGTSLIYANENGVYEVDPNQLLRENPNLIRELMGNDDPPIGHWGPLPKSQQG